jgi:Fe2+ transport system protein B
MIIFSEDVKNQLYKLAEDKNIYLEGNILKIINASEDANLQEYIKNARQKDDQMREKRLEITKKVQSQNDELLEWKAKNEKINNQLKEALDKAEKSEHKALKSKEEAEKSKEAAINDLDLLQKRTQNQLIESIVKVSLWIISGVGVITTVMFALTLFRGVENKIVESMWSNMFGILLTNSFSIIGTIMGVKYASSNGSGGKSKKCNCKCHD